MQLFQPEQADAEGAEFRALVALQRHAGRRLQADGEDRAVLNLGGIGVTFSRILMPMSETMKTLNHTDLPHQKWTPQEASGW